MTRIGALPPPSPAAMRAAARGRGAFAESLPTLRLQRVALAEVAQAESLEAATTLEVELESDGVPVVIGRVTTLELASGDLSIERDEPGSARADADVENPDEALQILDERDEAVGAARVVAGAPVAVPPTVTAPQPVAGHTVRAAMPHELAAPITTPRRTSWACVGLVAASLLGLFGWAALRDVPPEPQRATGVLAGLGELPRLACASPQSTSVPPPILVPVGVVTPATAAVASTTPAIASASVAVAPASPAATPTPIAPATSAAADASPIATASTATASTVRANATPVASRAAGRPQRRATRVVEEPEVEGEAPVAMPVGVQLRAAADVDTLMRDATRAFAQGRWATAFHYADRARTLGPNVAATRMAVIAACRLRRVAKAEAAFRDLPQGQRAGVRNTCREHGVALPEPSA